MTLDLSKKYCFIYVIINVAVTCLILSCDSNQNHSLKEEQAPELKANSVPANLNPGTLPRVFHQTMAEYLDELCNELGDNEDGLHAQTAECLEQRPSREIKQFLDIIDTVCTDEVLLDQDYSYSGLELHQIAPNLRESIGKIRSLLFNVYVDIYLNPDIYKHPNKLTCHLCSSRLNNESFFNFILSMNYYFRHVDHYEGRGSLSGVSHVLLEASKKLIDILRRA